MKEIYEMKGAGRSIRGIAQELDVSRNTVRRYLNSPEAMRPRPRPPRGSRLDPYAEHIDRGMGEGLENCRVLMVDDSGIWPGDREAATAGAPLSTDGPTRSPWGSSAIWTAEDGGPGSSRHSMPARVSRRVPPSHERPRCDGCRHSSRPSLRIMQARKTLAGIAAWAWSWGSSTAWPNWRPRGGTR